MNKKNLRSHRENLQEDLARHLLNVPVSEGSHAMWRMLETARRELAVAVELANKELAGNPVAEIIAEHAMRQIGKRGFPQVVVDPDGSVMLEVHYEAPASGIPETAEATRKSLLPSIVVLRAEAQSLGIDTAPFGKNKTRLVEAIKASRNGTPVPAVKALPAPVAPAPLPMPPAPAPPEPVKPKMSKTAPAVGPVQVLEPDAKKVIPDEDDDAVSFLFDKTRVAPVSPIPSAPPGHDPVKRVVATPAAPPRKLGGRSLSDIAGKAESEVDINAILAKPVPGTPPSEAD